MFGRVEPTSFDLAIPVFGIPMRVHPMFWIISAWLGWNPENPVMMLVWVYVVFVSIMVHELGHALTARYFGGRPEIVLYAYGGYADIDERSRYSVRQDVLILLAGPGAGFVFYAVIRIAAALSGFVTSPVEHEIIWSFEWVNLWWGLVNLLPVWPLDGGQLARHFFIKVGRGNGTRISLMVSIGTGAALALWGISNGGSFMTFFFAFLAFESYQALQSLRA